MKIPFTWDTSISLISGDYSACQKQPSLSNSARTCHVILQVKAQIYNKNDSRGRMLDFMDNCPFLQEDFHYSHIQSLHALKEAGFLLKPDEYRRFTHWGATTAKVGSF
uniref:Beta/gamma crystallin 'Greek key' domain-containing protein n=1 Tax=Nothoprocta perdicaria TaxID=30464 RepID=A0A8C6ZG97_NOTPE